MNLRNSPDTLASTFAAIFSGINESYGCKRACKSPTQEKLFFKFPSLQNFLKPPQHYRHIKTKTQTRQ